MSVAQKTSVSTCITPPQSLVLMKNMIRLSVSSICYLRNVFPPDCFSSRDYAGLKVHQIECAEKDEDGELKIKHEDAFLLTQWLERGVFEALAKQYLKSLTFAVYTKDYSDLDVLIETYSFAFEYPEDAPAKINGQPMDRDSMKKQAVSFIRCLVEFAGTLEELPDDRWLTLKLTYYDDLTPIDYEPQYFTAAKSNIFQFDKNVLKVKIGKIETPAHTLTLKFSGVDSINDSFTIPTDTLSLEDKTRSGEASSSIGYSKSLIHHQKTGRNSDAIEELKISSLSIKKEKKGGDVVTRVGPATTTTTTTTKPYLLEEESNNTKMIDRVKEYILSEGSATMRKCLNRFSTERWIVQAAFDQLVDEDRVSTDSKAKIKETSVIHQPPSKFNAEADKENIRTPLPQEITTESGVSRKKTRRSEFIDQSIKVGSDNDSQCVRRSKRIRGRSVVIHDSHPPEDSGSETEVESQVIDMIGESQGSSIFTPQVHDKCSVIRDPLHSMIYNE